MEMNFPNFLESSLPEETSNDSSETFGDWYYLKLLTDSLEDDNNTDVLLNDDFNIGNCRGNIFMAFV